ncbi:short-chain dehydrogenase [Aminobacter sp. Y103A]|uniref:SDR family oxidoreductase n=1 Tax=Aminobacter sp. Y103A TaxID=1870862 RepID=UPI0025727385|nr:SDR family oxidoreductase [Aminobacter sp. SS-2016]BBD39633.1 short-chain dehydrogenase [Aminobacter sp. SS-2016]
MSNLANQNVLVIGGTSGIGEAVAQLAQMAGATVTVASRSVRKALMPRPDGIRALAVDVTDRHSVAALFEEVRKLDHVCLAAGPTALTGDFADIDPVAAAGHFDTRFWSTFHVAQMAGRRLAGKGSLSFIIGALSRKPMQGRAMVTAAQCAVEGLARGLAIDLAPIRVNTIVAGLTDTPMWSGLEPARRKTFFEDYAKKTPAHRVGMPQDVAAMVLAAMANPYVTGASLVVDGGSTIN